MSLIQPWSPGCCPNLRFNGAKICHCAACHNTFGGITGFDTHKRMDGCRPPEVCGLILRDQVWHWPPKESLIRWLAKI